MRELRPGCQCSHASIQELGIRVSQIIGGHGGVPSFLSPEQAVDGGMD